MNNIVILRSVFGKVGQSYIINPCIDPATGSLPPHIRPVDARGDKILSEQDKQSKEVLLGENEAIEVVDGTVFNLDKPIDKAKWEAIKHSTLIAPERFAKDSDGNYLIDGNKSKFGTAVLYVERPGEATRLKNTRQKLVIKAQNFVIESSKEDKITKCKLLGKDMRNAYDSDIEDFLLEYAAKAPNKIIDLYTGSDTEVRMLFIDALNKHVIVKKDGIYLYGDSIGLGVTDDATIIWMKQPENKKVVEMIKKQTYPELYKTEKK